MSLLNKIDRAVFRFGYEMNGLAVQCQSAEPGVSDREYWRFSLGPDTQPDRDSLGEGAQASDLAFCMFKRVIPSIGLRNRERRFESCRGRIML